MRLGVSTAVAAVVVIFDPMWSATSKFGPIELLLVLVIWLVIVGLSYLIVPRAAPRSWRFWYFWSIVFLTVIMALRSGSPMFTMLTGLPINLAILFLPIWGIVSLVRYLRRGQNSPPAMPT